MYDTLNDGWPDRQTIGALRSTVPRAKREWL
jgi:hypothetical protein